MPTDDTTASAERDDVYTCWNCGHDAARSKPHACDTEDAGTADEDDLMPEAEALMLDGPAPILQHPSARVHFDVRAEAAKLVAAYRAATFEPPTFEQLDRLSDFEAINRLLDRRGTQGVLDLVKLATQARGEVI